jgi:hypothetical protein
MDVFMRAGIRVPTGSVVAEANASAARSALIAATAA